MNLRLIPGMANDDLPLFGNYLIQVTVIIFSRRLGLCKCFEKQQVITSFQDIKPNKTAFFLLPASPENKKVVEIPTTSLLFLVAKCCHFFLHPHIRILGGRPPKTSKCLFYKT